MTFEVHTYYLSMFFSPFISSDMGSILNRVFGIQQSEYFEIIPNIFEIFFPKVFVATLGVLLKVFQILYVNNFLEFNFVLLMPCRCRRQVKIKTKYYIFGTFVVIIDY